LRRIIRQALTSFDFLYFVVLTSSVLALTQKWPTLWQQAFWTFALVSLSGVYLLDAYPGRRLVTATCGIGVLNMSVVMGLTYFGLYQVDLGDVPLLGGQVSTRDRLLGLQVFCIITYARFTVLAFRYPHRFVTIPGAKLCCVSSAEAFTFLHVSERTESGRALHKVAPTPARSGTGSALGQVTSALRAAAAHSGPHSSGALRCELELLCRECSKHLSGRRTRDIAVELLQSAHDSFTVVMLLPVFLTTLVDENDSLGATLLRARVTSPGSPVAVLVLCASWPLSFALTVAALLDAAPTWVALVITSFSALASALRLLQGSTMILRLLAHKFDFWLAFGYAVFAAASGCVALDYDPELAALWCLSQTLLPIVLLYDSLPAASGVVGQAHRLAFFPAYLVFCTACTGLLHTGRRFPGHRVEIRVLGIAQNPTQGCLSAHLVLFALALRYVYRAIRSSDDLVSVGGLRKTQLPRSDACLLRAAALNAQAKSKCYSFGASSRAQSGKGSAFG
jgi:hypothetical protein